MNQELLRMIDSISRERGIDKENVFQDLEAAIASGLRRQFQVEEVSEFHVTVDRSTGEYLMYRNGLELSKEVMGRIGAQTVKQVVIQLLRQDERGSIYDEFKDRVGQIISGTVVRFEGPTMIVNLSRVEGIMPRSEQIPGEFHKDGDRIQALVVEVRDTPSQVKIILSRSHPEMIRRLFEREVPEVGERTIEIKALAREAGARTKLAVASIDAKVDAVGACVGVRGSRIRNIVEELGGEKIDIVRWNESSQILIANALKPAEVAEVSLCFELGRATVVVNEDQLSLAIGKRGQNVRLAARLTGWDVDILTPQEFQLNIDRLEQTLRQVPEVQDHQDLIDKIIALGLIDVRDIEEVGEKPLVDELGVSEDLAERMVDVCTEEAKIVVKEQEEKKKRDVAAKDAARSALLSGPIDDAPSPLAGLDEIPGLGDLSTSLGSYGVSAREPESGEAGNAFADDDPTDRMTGSMESVPGVAPELVTHDERVYASPDELSPEEAAIHGPDGRPLVDNRHADPAAKEFADEQSEEAALAEGRIPAPEIARG